MVVNVCLDVEGVLTAVNTALILGWPDTDRRSHLAPRRSHLADWPGLRHPLPLPQ